MVATFSASTMQTTIPITTRTAQCGFVNGDDLPVATTPEDNVDDVDDVDAEDGGTNAVADD